jgi:hypothetical protein
MPAEAASVAAASYLLFIRHAWIKIADVHLRSATTLDYCATRFLFFFDLYGRSSVLIARRSSIAR